LSLFFDIFFLDIEYIRMAELKKLKEEYDNELQKLNLLTYKFKTSMNMYLELMNDDETLIECFSSINALIEEMKTEIETFLTNKKPFEEKIKKLEDAIAELEKKKVSKRGRKKVTLEDEDDDDD
jgi:uncharacterized UPF0160 family protein